MTTQSGTSGTDTLTGTMGDDALVGNLGNDTLTGDAGNDTLYGDLKVTFGTGTFVLTSTADNTDVSTAFNVNSNYSLDYDALISNSTLFPHVSIDAVGIDSIQYYSIKLQAGTLLTIDIDNTSTSLDTLINVVDAANISLAYGDDIPEGMDADPGSDPDVFSDTLMTFTALTTGTYYIAVANFASGFGLGDPISSGESYMLNLSINGEQTGSGGNDTLSGGDGNDNLIGGRGNDALDGGNDSDTAHYSGNRADYTVSGTAANFTIVDGTSSRDGTDTVQNVEFVKFADGTFAAADLLPPACFLPGTLIRTANGEIAVDKLAIGDLVVTADGRALPVKFIGRQTVVPRFADEMTARPICIKAGALGENLPGRDLYTSPGHAMVLGGILVIAGALVNGSSIRRMERVPERFTYFHVELDEHAVIFAEGAATETFCDNVPREIFDNGAEHKALYPDAQPIQQLDLPTVKSARQMPASMRQLLADRAAAIGATASVAA